MSNKGRCYGCQNEFTSQGMSKHIHNCDAFRQDKKNEKYMQLKVVAKENKDYFLFLAVETRATLRDLDVFLRKIWLECCGHLSCFIIDSVRYESDIEDMYDIDMEYDTMFVSIQKVLEEGMTAKYEYDFGSTTHLKIENQGMVEINKFEAKKARKIHILARNNAIDPYNSPRTGTCGYAGPLNEDELDMMYKRQDRITKSIQKDEEAVDKESIKEFLDSFDLDMMDMEIPEFHDHGLGLIFGVEPLAKMLNILSKRMLDILRKELKVKNASQLNKLELIDKLNPSIMDTFVNKLSRMGSMQIEVIRKIINNNGSVFFREIEDSLSLYVDYENLAINSMIFVGSDTTMDGQLMAVLPKELYHQLLDYEFDQLLLGAKRNDILIKLVIGLCHINGVIPINELVVHLEHLTNQEIDIIELVNILKLAEGFYFGLEIVGTNVAWWDVEDIDEILNEHTVRSTIPYKQFTKNEVIKYANSNYFDRTKEIQKFQDFILTSYEMDIEVLEEMCSEIVYLFLVGGMPTEGIELLTAYIEIPDDHVLDEASRHIMMIYDSSPQWYLKGHSPSEVEKYRPRPPVRIEPKSLDSVDTKNSNLFDMKTKQKIGRNDLCPCGSGKKYKHCCGK